METTDSSLFAQNESTVVDLRSMQLQRLSLMGSLYPRASLEDGVQLATEFRACTKEVFSGIRDRAAHFSASSAGKSAAILMLQIFLCFLRMTDMCHGTASCQFMILKAGSPDWPTAHSTVLVYKASRRVQPAEIVTPLIV